MRPWIARALRDLANRVEPPAPDLPLIVEYVVPGNTGLNVVADRSPLQIWNAGESITVRVLRGVA